MIHAYVFWYGDILVAYGLCGLVVFLLRKLSPKRLLGLGIVALAVGSLIFIFFGWSIPYWPQENYQQSLQHWMPSQESIQAEIAAYRGGWLEQMSHRVPATMVMQTFLFLTFMSWRCGGLMLIGMALFKWGALAAQRSKRFYWIMMGTGLGVGAPLVIYGILRDFAAGWSYDYSMFLGSQFNYWGSIPMALGYVAIVMLICKSGLWEKLVRRSAAVGRMALTNYLVQTIICTTIFYGHGLGLFGRVERPGQMAIVVGIWILQLVISPLWLRSFQFGPGEWLWRTLTYLKVQPVRRRAA